MNEQYIKLGHGSGGNLTRRLIDEVVLQYFDSPHLSGLPDSAVLPDIHGEIAMTTDSYVVDPIFFPGGNIGQLAVNGTINDLAVSGAIPQYITCGLVLEEGLPVKDLRQILQSMKDAADESEVQIVTGDTKVVPRDEADGIYINTTGLGAIPPGTAVPDSEMREDDIVVLSGPLGDHGAAVVSRRKGLNLKSTVESDCAPVTSLARAVLDTAGRVSFLRDVTRGGLATILNEAAGGNELGICIEEEEIPVRPEARSVCELLGIDPLYLACEGRITTIVDPENATSVIDAMRKVPDGCQSRPVGRVTSDYPGKLVSQTPFGTHRLIQTLSGEQLPRIC
ncbi:MAG: hydrogenase expression/formation protein HypE [Planctomycetota bacterium]